MKSVDWMVPERPMEYDQHEPDNLRLSVLVSLFLHGVLAALLLTLGLFTSNPPSITPPVVRINLLPADSLLPVEESESSEEPVVNELTDPELLVEIEEVAVPESPEPSDEVQLSPISERPPENLVEIDLPEVVEPILSRPANDQGRQREAVVPTRMALQQVIRSISEQNSSHFWHTDCNYLQLQNELIKCDETEEPDYSNPDNRYFVKVPQSDNARQAQRFIAGNSRELKARLNTSALEGIASEYIISELEAGIRVYSTTGNVPLQRLRDQMSANDPVYQQMKRIMGTNIP